MKRSLEDLRKICEAATRTSRTTYVATWCDKSGSGRMFSTDSAAGIVSAIEAAKATEVDALLIAHGPNEGFAREVITFAELCALSAKERHAQQCKACDGDGLLERTNGCDDPECCGPGRFECPLCFGTGTRGLCCTCSGRGVIDHTSETSSVCDECEGTGTT